MELRDKVVKALRWSAGARLLGQLFSWAITIAVIRLLAPQDYGLMAMAMVIISFLILLNTVGLDAVLVQEKELDTAIRRQIFGIVIVVNLFFFALLFFGAPAIAQFYGEAELVPILRVLSCQFLLLIFETLPQSALERELEFSHRSVVDFVTLVIGSLTTVALAFLDYGVWALVWGALATNATRMIGLNLIIRNLVWPSFSLRGMAGHLSFGSFVSFDRGLWYIYSESDKFIGGKLLGNQQLGYYAVAHQLASLPINKISGLLNAIAFPAFSQAHAHASSEKVREYLLKATRILSIAAFPVFFGMSCTARSLIETLLGEAWLPAAALLQVLGLVMPFRLLSNVFPPLLWGIGQPRKSAENFLLAALLMPPAFYIGARWGVMGLAYAWLAMYPVVFLVTAVRACSAVQMSVLRYLAQLVRPLCAGLTMYAIVSFVQLYAPVSEASWVYLLSLILTGAVAYGGAMFVFDREGVRETVALLRNA